MTGDEIDLLIMAHYRALGSQTEIRKAIRCDRCGALVLFIDSAIHDNWHNEVGK